jgi:hypothetical protein
MRSLKMNTILGIVIMATAILLRVYRDEIWTIVEPIMYVGAILASFELKVLAAINPIPGIIQYINTLSI